MSELEFEGKKVLCPECGNHVEADPIILEDGEIIIYLKSCKTCNPPEKE